MSQTQDTLIGTRLADKYEILQRLGEGGMATVYSARDLLLKRSVAVKVIRHDVLDAAAIQRFAEEATTLARFQHPGIVQIYDLGYHAGAPFFVMPLIDASLRTLTRDKRLDALAIVDICIQLADALTCSHETKIYHLDLKPENVLISAGNRAILADFGLAVFNPDHKVGIRGTTQYMAPEQFQKDSGAPTPRWDIYSFGVLLFELLSGNTPFASDANIHEILNTPPPSLSGLAPDVPHALADLTTRCLSKRPENRPQTFRDVWDELNKIEFPRPSPPATSIDSDFIGRGAEISRFTQWLDSPNSQFCLMLVSGPRAIGRSRFVEELGRLAKERGLRVLHAAVRGGGQRAPYASLCTIIEEYCCQAQSADALSHLAPQLLGYFPNLSDVPQFSKFIPEPVGTTGANSSEEIANLLARAFKKIGYTEPRTLVVLEGLHRAEAAITALHHIVATMGASPLILVATFCTDDPIRAATVRELIDPGAKDSEHHEVELEPFTISEHRRFVAALLGDANVHESVIQRTYVDGRPGWAEQLIQKYKESKQLVQSASGTWQFAEDIPVLAESLPKLMERNAEARIHALEPRALEILSAASIIDSTFQSYELQYLVTDLLPIENDLDSLVENGYLKRRWHGGGDRFAFADDALVAVLHKSLGFRKPELHARFAHYIETAYAGRDHLVLARLFLHYYAARERDKALTYGLRYAKDALGKGAAQEVLVAVRKIIELTDDADPARAHARLLAGQAKQHLGLTADALAEIDGAFQLFERANDVENQSRAATIAADIAWQRHRVSEVWRWVRRGLPLARQSDNMSWRIQLLSHGAIAANLRGETNQAAAYLSELNEIRPAVSVAVAHRSDVTLTIPFGHKITTLDPADTYITWGAEVAGLIFDTLTDVDQHARIVPRLAHVEPEAEFKRYRIRLRDDVFFHNGRQLRAADVKYSFERFMKSAEKSHLFLVRDIAGADEFLTGSAAHVDGIRLQGERELIIQLTRALPSFALALSYAALGILPEGTGQLGRDYHSAPGTGPFRLARFEAGDDRILLEANPQYWRKGVPGVRALSIVLGLSSAEIARGFKERRFALALDLSREDHDQLRRGESEYLYDIKPTLSTCFVALNANGDALRNRTARESILSSINVDEVARRLGATATVARSIFPPALLDASRRRRVPSLRTPVHRPLTAGMSRAFATLFGGVAEAIVQSLQDSKVPITLNLTPPQTADELAALDIYFSRFYCDYPDADGFALGLLHSTSGLLGALCGSDEIDKMLDEARQERNANLRFETYRRLEELLANESLMLPLFHQNAYAFASADLDGFSVRNFFPPIRYEQLSMRG